MERNGNITFYIQSVTKIEVWAGLPHNPPCKVVSVYTGEGLGIQGKS